MPLTLRSPAFEPQGTIPPRFTCDGEDVSPALAWDGVPAGARSLALVVDDPDAPDPAAPTRVFVHWVLHDLPPDAGGLAEGVARDQLPGGAREGTNDWDRRGYGGPCPPVGRHRYFFKLYALDVALGDLGAGRKTDVEHAMRDHVLETAQLVGTYERPASARKR